MAKIATHDCARSRKRSIDPRTDWVYLLVSYRPLASKQIVDRILGRYASRMDSAGPPGTLIYL